MIVPPLLLNEQTTLINVRTMLERLPLKTATFLNKASYSFHHPQSPANLYKKNRFDYRKIHANR